MRKTKTFEDFDVLAVGAEFGLVAIERKAALFRELAFQSRLAQQRQEVVIDPLAERGPLGFELPQFAWPRGGDEACEPRKEFWHIARSNAHGDFGVEHPAGNLPPDRRARSRHEFGHRDRGHVAIGRAAPNLIPVEKDDLPAALLQLVGDGRTDDPCADYHGGHAFPRSCQA